MSGLEALWLVSLIMATFSLAIMIALLIARSFSGFLERRRQVERERLVAILLGQADSPPVVPKRRFARKLLSSLSVELIQLVRGTDRERFVANATAMGVPERLRRQLHRGSVQVRLAAAEALAQFADDRSVRKLNAALEDLSPDVRIAAALSLASVGEPPPAAELVYKLGIGTSENSLLAISLFRDVASRRPDELKALLIDIKIPAGAKAAVIESLSASADYTLVSTIVSLVSEEDEPAHLARYLRALGVFGHPAGEPAVKRGLHIPNWEVRAAAAEAAGRIGLASLAPNLRQLLGDSEWWVRFRAGEALAKLGAGGVTHLREAARSAGEPARTAATRTLAERGLK